MASAALMAALEQPRQWQLGQHPVAQASPPGAWQVLLPRCCYSGAAIPCSAACFARLALIAFTHSYYYSPAWRGWPNPNLMRCGNAPAWRGWPSPPRPWRRSRCACPRPRRREKAVAVYYSVLYSAPTHHSPLTTYNVPGTRPSPGPSRWVRAAWHRRAEGTPC